MKKLMFILIWSILISKCISGQCPDKQLLNEQIFAIFYSKLPPKEKVSLLLKYVDTVERCPYKIDSIHATLLRFIGRTYAGQGEFTRGIQYVQQSVDLVNNNIGNTAINPADLVKSYFWLHNFYDSVNNMHAKMKAVERCIKLAGEYNMESSIECVRSLLTKVKDLYDKGDYHRCIDNAKMCEKFAGDYAVSVSTPREFTAGRIIASISLGWLTKALMELKEYNTAEQYLTNKINEYTTNGLEQFLGFIYGELAEVEMSEANYKKALSLLYKSLALYRKDSDNLNIKAVMNTIGYNIYFNQFHDHNRALSYLKNAFAVPNSHDAFSKKDDSAESMSIVNNIANIYVHKRLYDSAFHYFKQAFYFVKPGINESNIMNLPEEDISRIKKIHFLSRLMIDFGDAYLKKYIEEKQPVDGQRALQIYKHADVFLNRINFQQSELESKLFWRRENRRLFEHAIEACYLQGNNADAFYFFEKSRAVLLNNELITQQNLGADMIAKQVEVKKKILQLKKEINGNITKSKSNVEIQQNLFRYQQELEQLEQSIKLTNPLYYQTVLDTSRISLRDITASLLGNHQAILEIFSGDSAVYSLLITPKHVYLNKISKTDFDNTTNSYISYISNPDLLNKDFPGYTRTAHHLYKLIFGKNPLPKGRIIVSPDGRNFPFEALVTSAGSSPVYFLNDHAVSYTYSARYLQNNFISNASVAASGSFLGVAPVQYASNSSLATLNGSDLSLNKIGAFMSGTHNLVGVQASKDNFLRQFSNYKVIQLYTHASDSSVQNEPVIHFADAPLYLSDLLPEKTPATQLIVLSACETGIGKLYQGEGIFSFNRGFAAFGVPSSISNLWAVDNLSTYALTELFYKYLAKDLPIDIALQKAKLEFLKNASKEKALPYYWAATVLVGKTDPIEYDNPSNWKIPVLISGIAGLLLFVGWRQYSRRKKPVFQGKKFMPV